MGGLAFSPERPNWSTVPANGSETSVGRRNPSSISIRRRFRVLSHRIERPSWIYGGMAESEAARKARTPPGKDLSAEYGHLHCHRPHQYSTGESGLGERSRAGEKKGKRRSHRFGARPRPRPRPGPGFQELFSASARFFSPYFPLVLCSIYHSL